MIPIAILTLVCALTYTFEIIFGLAGTILMLFLLSALFDVKTLVIYSVMPQILVAVIGLVRSPKTVNIRFLAGMLFFAVFGAVAGLYLFYLIPTTVFHISLATAVTLFGFFLVIMPNRLQLNPVSARAMDTLAGTSQALFGISGPIAMTRLLGTFKDKIVVRNYALAFFLALNVFRAIGYAVNKTITLDIAQMMMFSAPFLVVTLWFSNRLHFKINESSFRRVVSWVILLGGITLFYR